jgi:L-threonylcarbamoyladenylate synthase
VTETIPAADRDAAFAAARDALRAGDLVVVPTDTVYALVADAFQPRASRRIFEVKRRTRHVPLPVLVRSPRQAIGLVKGIPESAERLMASYWPGPLTLVMEATEGLTMDLGETRGTLMLRMPADDLLTDLVAEIGPLVCTGANRAGLAVPTTPEAALEQLGDDAVAVCIDGGSREAVVSTVVDVTGEKAIVLREGAVTGEDIEQVATGAVGWGQRPAEQSDEPTPEAIQE